MICVVFNCGRVIAALKEMKNVACATCPAGHFVKRLLKNSKEKKFLLKFMHKGRFVDSLTPCSPFLMKPEHITLSLHFCLVVVNGREAEIFLSFYRYGLP